ncbi:EF-hand calcium-binding domain-containing protein 13-like [Alexandromys fortis]|uniref:EF-hand calcium-binding domain-containing protein 13-like n=1 Tax=Alexandromys fortis TaxID=100897 RepID=UPI00215356D5|nr:EF-hand calcium-binding domain-containing protein 13-like [Microtus fortis]
MGTGRFSLSSLMNAANLFSGGKIEAEDIQPYLESLGIELTDSESQMIKNIVPVDDDNMVYQNVLMDALRTRRSGKVSLDKIDDALEQLGYPLEEEEIEELSKHLPVNHERTVRMDLLLEEVSSVLGEEIDFNDMDNVLKNIGLRLHLKENNVLMKGLPIDAAGKVYKHKLMDGVLFLKGAKLDLKKLQNFMENMGYDLEKNEYEDLINYLPINDDGMVNMNEVIDKGSLFTGEKIDLVELDAYLESIGVKLTEDKMMKLLGKLPADASGKLYKKRLIKELENIEGIKIPSNKVKDFIKNAEINLDDEDIQILMDHLPVDRNGKADFSVLMNGIKRITGEKIHAKDIKSILEDMGIEMTNKENRKLLKTLPVSTDKTLFKKELLSGVKSFKGGRVNVHDMKRVLHNTGFKLEAKELKDLQAHLPVTEHEKVDLDVMMDAAKSFTGALDTVSSHCGGGKGKTKGLLLLRPLHSHHPMQERQHDLLPLVATILKMKFQWEMWRELKWSCCCHHRLLRRAAPCCTDPSTGDKCCPLTRLKKRFQITPD